MPLYTIGYGSRSFDQFVVLLQDHGIQYLLDVRTAPYSRFKPEFSKNPLQNALEPLGIRYVFMGDTLGGQPEDPACLKDGKVDYQKVRAQPFFQSGLEQLKILYAQKQGVALLCSEGRPERCHRSKLIGHALASAGIPVCHIDETGQLLTQAQVMDRLTRGQLDFFG